MTTSETKRGEEAWADYKLVQGATASPIGTTNPHVRTAIEKYFTGEGWAVKKEDRPNPFDLSATRGDERVLIETKVPSPGLDLDALLGQMVAYATDPGTKYIIAVPSSTVAEFGSPSTAPEGVDVSLYEVSDTGSVVKKEKIPAA